MIITTELLDKTCIIAAMLAMKHAPLVVFSGAASALFMMTCISALVGRFISEIISPQLVHFACVGLFAIFGCRLLWEAMEPGESEFDEVEVELRQADSEAVPSKSEFDSEDQQPSFGVRLTLKLNQFLKSSNAKVAMQAFLLTFIGEWGDRSQIATVGLAAQGDTLGVSLGGFSGHLLCTAIAVAGGRALASKISIQQVNIAGGVLFLLFAIVGLVMGQ